MANQFTIYRNTDLGAPILNGLTGSLCNLLSASLVAGYGNQSGSGWLMPYTGSSTGSVPGKAVFQQKSGNQMFLRVDDTGLFNPAQGTQEAFIRGYETMTNVDTGSGLFPTSASFGYGIWARKSLTKDNTPRPWILVADDRTFYFGVQSEGTTVYYGFGFGDFYSFVNNDGYRTMIIGRNATSNAAGNEGLDLVNNLTGVTIGCYMARGHYGLGSAINFGKTGDYSKSGGSGTLFGSLPYTNPADGGLYISNLWLSDPTTPPTTGIRGRLRGFWQWLHPITNINDQDTFTGTGDLAGKTFLIVKQTPNAGVWVIETSATLETN